MGPGRGGMGHGQPGLSLQPALGCPARERGQQGDTLMGITASLQPLHPQDSLQPYRLLEVGVSPGAPPEAGENGFCGAAHQGAPTACPWLAQSP